MLPPWIIDWVKKRKKKEQEKEDARPQPELPLPLPPLDNPDEGDKRNLL